MVKLSKLKKHWKYNQSGQLRYVVKYKVKKNSKKSVKTPLLLFNIIDADKTADWLQTKATFYNLFGF